MSEKNQQNQNRDRGQQPEKRQTNDRILNRESREVALSATFSRSREGSDSLKERVNVRAVDPGVMKPMSRMSDPSSKPKKD